ncbi:MAG: hypothetical protein M0P13_04680 [Fibrobacteraceae bacterium]|nr:hypothetical protein [Fibrobacteraceae bacterium]
MTKLKRDELKRRFSVGQMPSEMDFADLIDSMVNSEEEGFDKTAEDGLKLSQLMDSGHLMSFYENVSEEAPLWFSELRLMQQGKVSFLHISTPRVKSAESVISLKGPCPDVDADEGEDVSPIGVGIRCRNPECELDVNGTVASSGRIGKEGNKSAPADGRWHDITDVLTGCQAFEIVAGVGGRDKDGKFALTHAFALNVFGCKPKIQKEQSHSGWRGNRIDVRWVKADSKFNFKLQLRVRCSYGEGVWIRYRLTKLWFDSLMEDSLKNPVRE